MKVKFIAVLFAGILYSVLTYGQASNNLIGEWTFEIPDAPEGATTGIATVKADTVVMSFEGGIQFSSDWVKVTNDSILYQTTFDEMKVRFALKVVDDQNLSGRAVASDGESAVTFRRKKV